MSSYVEIFDGLNTEELRKRIRVGLWRLALAEWVAAGAGDARRTWAERVLTDDTALDLRKVMILVFADDSVDVATVTDAQLQARLTSVKDRIMQLGAR